jgi:hypothetical protein
MKKLRIAATSSLVLALGAGAVAADAATTSAAAKRPKAGLYSGTTNQKDPDGKAYKTSFKVTKSRKAVRGLALSYAAPCDNDDRVLRSSFRVPSAVKLTNNRLRGEGPLEISLPEGRRAEGTFQIDLDFTRKGAKGVWRVDVEVFEADGTQSNACQSGDIKWTAKRR